MRILISSLNYAPEPTGIGKYSGQMAAWLAGRGHDVHVVAAPPYYPWWRVEPSYRGRGYRTESLDGVRVYRAPIYVRGGKEVSTAVRLLTESSFTLTSVLPWVRLAWARPRFDVVVAVVPPLQSALWPALYAWARRAPLLIHVQDLQVDAAVRLGFFRRSRGLTSALYRAEAALLQRATRVTTVTEQMRQRIIAKGLKANRVGVFPNWADVGPAPPSSGGNRIRRELGLRDEQVLVLYSGNMGEKQGLGLVLDVAQAFATDPNVVFAFFGNGASRSALERKADARELTNVLFRDLVPAADLPVLLAAGDIHLVPQRRDAADLLMPSKVANIMSAGRPFIATCDEGTALAEVVSESGGGVRIAPDDAGGLVIAIKELAADASGRKRMGKDGQRYACETLSRDAVLGTFEAELGLLERRGNDAEP